MKRFYRIIMILAAAVLLLPLFSCTKNTDKPQTPAATSAPMQNTPASDEANGQSTDVAVSIDAAGDEVISAEGDLAVWVTYWQSGDYETQIAAVRSRMTSLSYFAAYFNEDGTLYTDEDSRMLFFDAAQKQCVDLPLYLTIVNDVKLTGGGSLLKDTDILRRLLASGPVRDAHIQNIVKTAAGLGFDGVELDYEAIGSDSALWTSYTAFIEELAAELQKSGMTLRVILEPSALGAVQFPACAEYIVMCYNLYGAHSDTAGAKADYDFIRGICEKAKTLPNDVTFAFANGGYDFVSGGDAQQLTDTEAAALQKSAYAEIQRDDASGALWFNYYDKNALMHTVYYSDAQTLLSWIDTARECGAARFALWRLGGCDEGELVKLIG